MAVNAWCTVAEDAWCIHGRELTPWALIGRVDAGALPLATVKSCGLLRSSLRPCG